ncbi:hypothetical protein FD754_021383 [Muntiacus muntjak]|uniref:EF-hand domain-containing protein n=1 Tax=Muntiacus muntjak TaxID=9888 RepID=A0A5N3V5K8_MUNMU|nr:hypothetical protein FD754_021383 [Muntiacus muntjak]
MRAARPTSNRPRARIRPSRVSAWFTLMNKIKVKDDKLDATFKEASGPINFTMFLNVFGEKLSGMDPEETVLSAFKMLDPAGKGSLMSQANNMTAEEVDQMFQFSTSVATGNLTTRCWAMCSLREEE